MVKFDISQAENAYLIYNICMKKLSKRVRIGMIILVVVLCAGVVGVTVWLILGKVNETTNEVVGENTETTGVEEVAEFVEPEFDGVSTEMIAAIRLERYYLEKNLERYAAYARDNVDLTAEEIVRNVNSNLDRTRYVDVKDADLSYGVLAMINKYNYLGNYEPDDLEYLGDGYTNGTAPYMRREAAEAFRKMANAARAEGLTLMNISGYRSYSLQDWLYKTYAAQDGYALADTYSSRPGYSEHQAGLATDINSVEVSFASTAEFQWLQEHAADYGFIMRYPDGLEYITGFSYEPWHYRYVGVEAAQQIVREGLTFDEYYAYYVEK